MYRLHSTATDLLRYLRHVGTRVALVPDVNDPGLARLNSVVAASKGVRQSSNEVWCGCYSTVLCCVAATLAATLLYCAVVAVTLAAILLYCAVVAATLLYCAVVAASLVPVPSFQPANTD